MTTVALAIVASMLVQQPAPDKAASNGPHVGRTIGRHLKDDLRGMISPASVLVLGTGAAVAVAVRPKDRDVSRSFESADSLERALEPGNGIGDGYLQMAAAAGTWVAGRATHHPRLA